MIRTDLLAGSVSIDLDTLSDYARGYAFSYRTKPDPVYALGLPRFLDLLARHNVRATIFVIARDARLPQHAEVLRRAVDEGHEIANHTLTHPRNLSQLPEAELVREIDEAHEVLARLCGREPVGFRAPCYDIDNRTMDLLRALHYRYDSSIHPIALAAAIDLAVLVKSQFRIKEFRTNTYKHVFSPVKPYRPARDRFWRPGKEGSLLELPLSTVPRTRMPFYGTFVQATGMDRFRKSLASHARSDRPLNFHFHGVEMVDINDEAVDPRFGVHPGMSKLMDEKGRDIDEMVGSFAKHYDLMPLAELAERWSPQSVEAAQPAPALAGENAR